MLLLEKLNVSGVLSVRVCERVRARVSGCICTCRCMCVYTRVCGMDVQSVCISVCVCLQKYKHGSASSLCSEYTLP